MSNSKEKLVKDLVSAIITTYQRENQIIERALKSVLSQTYEMTEVLLIDDNREDTEKGQLLSKSIQELLLQYPSVQYFRTEEGHGAQRARNTGIQKAQGNYLAFLDDDDEWMPEKISRQVQALNENKSAGMCFTRGYRVNENFTPPYVNDFQGKDFLPLVTYQRLLRGDCIGTTSQAMICKEVFAECGGFDEKFPARQDYEMWIRISQKFEIIGVDEPLFRYHIAKGENQITKSWDRCIIGHTLLYQKYKVDIDRDRKAKFNVIFYLAYYHRRKCDSMKALCYYIQSFFVSPYSFYEKGKIKIEKLKEERKQK